MVTAERTRALDQVIREDNRPECDTQFDWQQKFEFPFYAIPEEGSRRVVLIGAPEAEIEELGERLANPSFRGFILYRLQNIERDPHAQLQLNSEGSIITTTRFQFEGQRYTASINPKQSIRGLERYGTGCSITLVKA